MKKIVFWAFIFSQLASCRRDHPIQPECFAIPYSTSPIGYQDSFAKFRYHSPCFNPNNSDEFLYVKDESKWDCELRLHILRTGKDVFLATTWDVNAPRWNKNGWITFSYNYQVWKVKEDGTGLTNFPQYQDAYFPDWSPDGSKIVFEWEDNTPWPNLTIISSQGDLIQMLDSNIGGSHTNAMSPNGSTLAYDRNKDIGLTKIGETVINKIENVTNDPQGIFWLSWFPDGRSVVWTDIRQLGKTDIGTGKTVLLRQPCNSRSYINPSVSGDGSQIIVEREDITKVSDNILYYESYIYIMNADGSNEHKVEL